MSQQQMTNRNDEISLREIIEILLDFKWMIVLVTAVALILSGIATVTLIDKEYEASVMITVADFEQEPIATDAINDLVELQKYSPSVSVSSYLEQVKSPQVLSKVIEELQLKNNDGELISASSLSGSITTENPKDTNIITITVISKSADESASIANAIGNQFQTFINNNVKEQSQSAADMIESQLLIEEGNLEAKSKAVADYLANNTSISELKNTVSTYESNINSYNTSLINLEPAIEINKANLEALVGSEIDLSILEDIAFSMDLSGDVSLDGIESDLLNENTIQSALISIEVTNLQKALIKQLTQQKVYAEKLDEFKAALTETRNILSEQEYRYNALNRDLSLATQTYTAYQQRHKEAVILAAANIGSSGINIASNAVVPSGPTSPNLMLNLAIGIVLGLMIGVFLAFFRAYWMRTGKK